MAQIQKTDGSVRLDEFNAELQNAMNQLKASLSQAQVVIGVVESFLYLVRKESQKLNTPPEAPAPSVNGKDK